MDHHSSPSLTLEKVVAGVGAVGVKEGANHRNFWVVANDHFLQLGLLPVREDVINGADGAIFKLPVFQGCGIIVELPPAKTTVPFSPVTL